MYDKPFKNDGQKQRKKRKKPKKSRGAALVHMLYAVNTVAVYAVNTLAGCVLPYAAYVDTACARSVMGVTLAEEMFEYCTEHDWPIEKVSETEPFRFGPGNRILSAYASVVCVIWGGQLIVLRISVIPRKNVPCLISKHVCRRLGANIDLEDMKFVLK